MEAYFSKQVSINCQSMYVSMYVCMYVCMYMHAVSVFDWME